jgi:D-alanyl-D-alanine carboxypeptidase
MRWSLRLLLTSALLAGLALPAAARPAPAPPVTSPADLRRLLDGVVATGAPGAIGAVEDDGRTIRRVAGVGNLRTGQPPRPVQTFRVASQTKAFVATVVLQLVAAGKVGLDDQVGRYLPSRLLPPGGDRITVRQLLNHTSGLHDPQVEVYQTLQDIYDLRLEHWTPREVLALAADNGLLFPPGTAFSYSNTNYVVAGLLIERVTGTSVARQLGRRLIRPLGLRHTWFATDTAALPPPRLRGYMPLDDRPPLVDADITRFNPSFFWAAGALVSNLDDLDRFYDALFDGRLLPRRLLAEMLTPVDTGAPGVGYGLGLEIYTLPCGAVVAGHTGALPGYNSGSFRLLGDDKDARVVANLHPAPDTLYLALSAALVELFCGMTPAQAAAAARANPGTAAVIRFR